MPKYVIIILDEQERIVYGEINRMSTNDVENEDALHFYFEHASEFQRVVKEKRKLYPNHSAEEQLGGEIEMTGSQEKKESPSLNEQVKLGYTLSFQEAILACLGNKGFIRGNRYSRGMYVKNKNNVLVMVDGKRHHQIEGNMLIYDGALTQKYKLFTVANDKELE